MHSNCVEWRNEESGLAMSFGDTRNVSRFQVYGQRCSGTNYLIRLIENNFGRAAFTEEFGFKHWLVPDSMIFPNDVMVLVIVRDPGEWIQSLFRNPWHLRAELKSAPFHQFMRGVWDSCWDDDYWKIDATHPRYHQPIEQERDPETGAAFANPFVMRRAKLQNWTGLASRVPVVILNYSLAARDPGRILQQLSSVTGLELPPVVAGVDSYKGEQNRPFVAKNYGELCDADRRFMLSQLDPEMERLAGCSYDYPA